MHPCVVQAPGWYRYGGWMRKGRRLPHTRNLSALCAGEEAPGGRKRAPNGFHESNRRTGSRRSPSAPSSTKRLGGLSSGRDEQASCRENPTGIPIPMRVRFLPEGGIGNSTLPDRRSCEELYGDGFSRNQTKTAANLKTVAARKEFAGESYRERPHIRATF